MLYLARCISHECSSWV